MRGRWAGVGKRSFLLLLSTLSRGVLRLLPDDDVDELEDVLFSCLDEEPDDDVEELEDVRFRGLEEDPDVTKVPLEVFVTVTLGISGRTSTVDRVAFTVGAFRRPPVGTTVMGGVGRPR